MNILIADDNAQNRYMLEQLLTAAGHTCVSVANGREALTRVRGGSYQAIVSDILMPVMDGFQFCRELKSDPALAGIPFMFYTATYTEPGDVEFGLKLGAAHYLVKPSEPEVILAALGNLHRSAGPASPAPEPDDYLAQYNARLVTKLESKMLQLERANADLLKSNFALSDEVGRRRTAEKSASAALALQQATLESTADGIVAVNDRGRVLAWNRSFIELFGLPPETAPVGTLDEMIASLAGRSAEPEPGLDEWRGAVGTPGPVEPTVLSLNDGRVLERLGRPLQLGDGRSGRVWTVRDVTERHRAEAGRHAMQMQLFELQKVEALGVLAGGIAHDFNNILTAMLGRTSLASMMLEPTHPAQESLADAVRAGQRAAELVRQILTFSRHQEPIRQVLRLEPVISEALKLAGSTLPAGVQVTLSTAAEVPNVKVDPTQIHQVLINLITNANHAMKGRGRVRVTLSAVTMPGGQGPPDLRPGHYAVIGVGDTGPGIDERVRRRIFEPFFTTKPAGQGTGLGLAVVHGIVIGYGGYVEVTNQPGSGAEFRLYLPAVAGEVTDSNPPALAGVRRGAGELVLVAEDDTSVRDFLRVVLERMGYRCETAPSAEEALAKFQVKPTAYAVLLSDLSMPGMSGIELSRAVHLARPELPVIIMTGYLSADEIDLDQIGRDFNLLRKPCSAEALSDMIHLVLGQRR